MSKSTQPPPSREKRRLPCELLFILGILLVSFAITLYPKTQVGIATLPLAAYVLNLAFPSLTYGTWNYVLQCLMIVVMAIALRKIKRSYLMSFIIAIIFGYLVDFFSFLLRGLVNTPVLNVLYYFMALSCHVVGLYTLLRCRLPVMPIDTLTREVSAHYAISFKTVRTVTDVSLLILALAVGYFILGAFPGIGPGTVITSLFLGILAQRLTKCMDRYFYCEPVFSVTKKLMDPDDVKNHRG